MAEVTLLNGDEVPEDGSHKNLRPDGQQKNYVVLSELERARGFEEPVRDSYVHAKCGAVTTMGRALSETYAAEPEFYTGTFCVGCRAHFPVGDEGEFWWNNTNQRVGTLRDPTTHREPFDTSAWLAARRPL